MQITFLGASHGVPEANRRCSCTLIETNGRYYFIDMGVNAIDALRTRGIEVEDVKGIFITHMHGDHTNGLISFVDLISWYFQTADPEICLPNLEGVEAIRAWLKANHCEMRDLRFKKITDGTIFDDGYLKVTAIPTQHCPDSHAFFVEAEGKAVLFTGDLKRQGKADRICHLRGRTLPGDRLRARFGRLSHKAGARQPLRAVEYPERHAACGNARSAARQICERRHANHALNSYAKRSAPLW